MIKIILSYLLSFSLSTVIVRETISLLDKEFRERAWKKLLDVGFVVGLCETFLVITFILHDELVALGLVFTAKSIARVRKMEEKPEYYLLGTLVNFTISFLFGLIIKSFII
ncbi:MAG: hypothetical protein OEZ31_11175 [Nitrospirota bacterium]|nr:hypothetical protein [candidate division WOR-3 bacterium]MDH5769495.1 hypothetical protein [Nitrospirota bacterium]